MRRTPFKAKRDANEAELFAILRGHGLDVEATDKPLDAIVGYGGKTYLVEIKDGPKARMRPFQEAFFGRWRGHATILRSVDDAEQFSRAVRAGDV